MNQQQCAEIGEKLVRRFKTRDPFVIAEGLGIQIYDNCEIGNLKGFYKVIKRNRCIFSIRICRNAKPLWSAAMKSDTTRHIEKIWKPCNISRNSRSITCQRDRSKARATRERSIPERTFLAFAKNCLILTSYRLFFRLDSFLQGQRQPPLFS